MALPVVVSQLLLSTLLLFCGYRSFKALESERNSDDTKWLTFWFVYTLFSFAKSMCDYLGKFILFYQEGSLAIVVYLAFFGGSRMVYGLLKPLLKKHEAVIDKQLNKAAEKAEQYGGKSAAAVFVSPDKAEPVKRRSRSPARSPQGSPKRSPKGTPKNKVN